MNCPNCGVFLLSSAKVCDACGAEIISLTQPENNGANGGTAGAAQTAPQNQNAPQPSVRPRYDEPVFQGNSQRMNKRFPDSVPQNDPPAPAPKKAPKQPRGGGSKVGKIVVIVVLVIAVIAVVGLVRDKAKKDSGSGNSSGSSIQTQTGNEKVTEKKTTERKTEVTKSNGQSVSIVSHSIVKDINGNDTLLIEYAWTNNSNEATSFMVACRDHVYQNGVECPSYASLLKEVDSKQEMNDVKPGATYNLKIGYTLQDKTNALVEITDIVGTECYLSETIDLGGGEGNPSGTSAGAKETTLKISDMFLSKDYENKDVLVIKYEFTNGEDHPISFSNHFEDKVYQNGVECSSLAVFCDDVDTNTSLVSIKPGVTTIVEEGYLLQDMSDVEIEVKELFTHDVYLSEKRSIK